MPVNTRRGGRLGRGFELLPEPRRSNRSLVNVTAQTAANPTVSSDPIVTTVSNQNSNAELTNQTIVLKDPKLSKFSGSSDALKVEPFLNIFNRYFNNIDEELKVLKLGEYLTGDALNFFGTDIISDLNISWSEVKSRLIRRYGHSDIPPMLSAIRRRLQKHESIKQYFDDKCQYLRQERGLTEATQTQLLTDGLPDHYRQHFYGKRFESTTVWLQTAQDIEADLCRHKPALHQSSAHFNRSDQWFNKSNKTFANYNGKPKEKRPPYPCKICRDQGITSYHWHSDCPNKITDGQTSVGDKQKETHPKLEAHYTTAEALVTPKRSGDEPILVKTYIKNKKVMAFVDTGANVNLIPESVVYEFGLSLNKQSARPVKTANGYAQTLGSVSFELSIDGKCETVEALVIKGFEYTLLLSRTKLMIDTDLMSAKPKILNSHCNLTNDHIQEQSRDNVGDRLIRQFSNLFATDSTDLGRIDVEYHRILLNDCEPKAQRPYRQSIPDAEETARQVRDLLAKGLIRESVSPYAAPITLADKKDGTKRLCVDYRRLNKITVADKTPLPLIADVIDRLRGMKIFSKLDFASGYWQVPVHPEDISKTSFVTRDGHFEWLVLPFGLKNSPSTFHRVVRKILGNLVNTGVMSYLDDIVVYAEDQVEHDRLLTEVFNRLSTHNARLKLSKCEFACNSIEFLGHVVDGTSVRPPIPKIKAIMEYPIPTDRKSVERFHGLINYLREYIPNFALIAEPLTRLLRKDEPFVWSENQTQSFNHFKELLSQSPVRHIYDPSLECELHTDASTVGIGSILIQCGHPIGYYSRKLSDAETRYTVTEQECLALVEGIKHFRVYLESTKFKVYTDHIALKWLLNFESTKKRLYRWSQELSLYDFDVIHRPGKRMAHVDALSRAPVCNLITDNELITASNRDLSSKSKYCSPIDVITNINQSVIRTERSELRAQTDCLSTTSHNGRDLKQVPPSLVLQVLIDFHDKSGHPGIRKTLLQIRNQYFWPEMKHDVKTRQRE